MLAPLTAKEAKASVTLAAVTPERVCIFQECLAIGVLHPDPGAPKWDRGNKVDLGIKPIWSQFPATSPVHFASAKMCLIF